MANKSTMFSSLGGLAAKLARPFGAVRRRLVDRRRRGSVLILVVALLVLLALIGTAFITSAGADRDATVQHGYNTQVDLLVQSVRDLTQASVLVGITPVDPPPAFANGQITFRPATPAVDAPGYEPLPTAAYTPTPVVLPKYYQDVDFLPWTGFLADRFPALPAGATGTPLPEWQYISASPLAGLRNKTNANLYDGNFQSPYVTASHPRAFQSRFRLAPTFLDVPTPNGQTVRHPAFTLNDPADPSTSTTVLAADADGDGIADSGLFELPIGLINGVRYYGAIRVIDNNAAINVSVAWENAETGSAVGPSITPVNVGLKPLLEPMDPSGPPTTGFAAFNTYRFGDLTAPAGTAIQDGGTPFADPNVAFWFPYDAVWTMLGSRLDNPGYITTTAKYRALGVTESAALAYRFCLANPNGAQSAMERYFPVSTRGAAVNRQPFTPDQASTWFNNIFDYTNLAATATPMRPLLVAHNGTSNFVPSFVERLNGTVDAQLGYDPQTSAANSEQRRAGQYQYKGNWDNTKTYHIGEWVRNNGIAWVAIARNTGQVPDDTVDASHTGLLYWAKVPWDSSPVKINPNTATFGQLMAAYYAVMADGPNVAIGTNKDPGYGSTIVGTFQNPVRNGETVLSAEMVKQLRAAQAAVNTIDLRDADDDVTSRVVMLSDDNGGSAKAMVYGMERQPYITEAVVHVDEMDNAYVAIELFNPYPTEMNLAAFQLAYRNRPTDTNVNPTQILKLTGTIPGYGYRYFESGAADRPPPTSNFTAPSPTEDAPKLKDVVAGGAGLRELLLMRCRNSPRKTAANPTPPPPTLLSNACPANLFAESEDGGVLKDFVPVDQLDFVGITPGLPLSTQKINPATNLPESYVTRFHYRRATARDATNTNGTDPWHCVYGGPYMVFPGGSLATSPPQTNLRREWGWVRDPWPTMRNDPTLCTPCGWGDKVQIPPTTAEPASRDDFVLPAGPPQATFHTRTLQVNNEGMPGPWKPDSTGASPPRFPFGGFARVGDILAVTYVGSYRIYNADPSKGDELNSVSMDAAMAEDGDKDDNYENTHSLEQLGRFAPILSASVDDIANRPSAAAPLGTHRYAWARDIFDYFTVNCPQDDYQANVDPAKTTGGTSGDPTLITTGTVDVTKYPLKWPFSTLPQAVANGLAVTDPLYANGGREDGASTHGLININTANWKVLSTLPFTNNVSTNENIAKTIVAHRETYGPFHNLFELQKVGLLTATNPPSSPVVFRDAMGAANNSNPALNAGDLSPVAANNAAGSADDVVFGDFESRYLMITRISNMVSFRSDSFTAYVLVQGWRNAGSGAPELVVQRRGAYLIDRSTVHPYTGGTPALGVLGLTPATVTTFPNN